MKPIGVVRFLGTNCDQDVWRAIEESGHKPVWLWQNDRFDPSDVEALIIPGGFSYGDYLRAGALAARAPVMQDVRKAALAGKPVLGICNGMQILTEAQLLPGAMVRNESLRFHDSWVRLVLTHPTGYWEAQSEGEIRLPVAHGEGRFYAEADELKRLEDEGAVWLRYAESGPNGSLNRIAGLKRGSVAALMPHPERAMAEWMGGSDGRQFFSFEG